MLLLLVGVMVVQVAWILAMPPFRAIDEFDHAYRAAAVAGGQWVAPATPADAGRGSYVRVPEDLVRAAGPVCKTYAYTLPENCAPASRLGHGEVEVASAASTYNPLFYWVVGTPSSAFDGVGFLYATRVISALLCLLLIAGAVGILASAGKGLWLGAAVACALSPCLIYSTTVGAPNGLEMCAGLACTAALLSLRRTGGHEARALVTFGVAASILVSVRLLGPVWLLLVVALGLAVVGQGRLLEVVRFHPRAATVCGLLVTAGSVWGVGWSLTQGTGLPSQDAASTPLSSPLGNSLGEIPVWTFQAIAMGPTRNEPAPTIVYGLALAIYASLLLFAARGMHRRQAAILASYVLTLIVLQVSVSTYSWPRYGSVWQGRYALPAIVAIPLVLAAFGSASSRARLPVAAAAAIVTTAAALQTIEVLRVAHQEGANPVYGDTWAPHSEPLLLGLTLCGLALVVLGSLGLPGRSLGIGGTPVHDGRRTGSQERLMSH